MDQLKDLSGFAGWGTFLVRLFDNGGAIGGGTQEGTGGGGIPGTGGGGGGTAMFAGGGGGGLTAVSTFRLRSTFESELILLLKLRIWKEKYLVKYGKCAKEQV